ncbi:MAG: hypothetical protein R2939_04105 [Kofleriaceae bacterium]
MIHAPSLMFLLVTLALVGCDKKPAEAPAGKPATGSAAPTTGSAAPTTGSAAPTTGSAALTAFVDDLLAGKIDVATRIDPAGGVVELDYVNETDEAAARAAGAVDGVVATARRSCDASALAALLTRIAAARQGDGANACALTPTPSCAFGGNDVSPTYELAFTGSTAADFKLVEIARVSRAAMTEAWTAKAEAYLAEQRQALATTTCAP